MALVAYEYSSGDEAITDEEVESSGSKVILTKSDEVPSSTQSDVEIRVASSLFAQLPQVKANEAAVSEESDHLEDFIPTVKTIKEKKKVQITIPFLSEFDDLNYEDPARKRPKPSDKGSGLLSMLPPVQGVPKSSTMFVPNTVKNAVKPTSSKALIPRSVKAAPVQPKAVKGKGAIDSDSDTDTEEIPIPETFDDQMWEKVCGRPKKPPKPAVVEVDERATAEAEEFSIAPEPEKPYDGLDNVAFKELVGKTKRPIGNIKLIDINEDEILPDRDLWLTKSLTDPELAPKAAPTEDMDPAKKKRHHITYLAQQAKANEQELKATWATSKNNRMMSRAKYGF